MVPTTATKVLSRGSSRQRIAKKATIVGQRKRPRDNKTANMPKAKRRRTVDSLFQHDQVPFEMPLEADYGASYAAFHANPLRWRFPPVVSEGSLGNMMAPAPRLPDPFDDAPRLVIIEVDNDDYERRKTKKGTKAKKVQKREIAAARKKDDQTEGPENKPKKDGSVRRRIFKERGKASFANIPSHIREGIYRELLVADKRILVHGGWSMIYKRRKPCLALSILLVNRRINAEATRILYSENTFLYRLRDAITTVTNVSRLALDDDGHQDASDDSDDSEYEEETARSVARRRGRSRATKRRDGDINIKKYLPLIRNIIVEAEPNRYSESTQQSMARAIQVFAQSAGSRKRDEKAPNIRTLTIRVAPLRTPEVSDTGDGKFTFVDFFVPGSPVIQAMKAIECQFLHIELMTKYMNGTAERSGCRLIVDMRHHRVSRRVAATNIDFWKDDRAMQTQRQERVDDSVQAIAGLHQRVSEFCRERVTKMVGGVEEYNDSGYASEWDEVWGLGDGF